MGLRKTRHEINEKRPPKQKTGKNIIKNEENKMRKELTSNIRPNPIWQLKSTPLRHNNSVAQPAPTTMNATKPHLETAINSATHTRPTHAITNKRQHSDAVPDCQAADTSAYFRDDASHLVAPGGGKGVVGEGVRLAEVGSGQAFVEEEMEIGAAEAVVAEGDL